MNTKVIKLIKLSDQHFIIVDDSEIKEGDYYFHTLSKKVERAIHCHGRKTHPYPKITHSTQPLEEFICNGGIKRIGWVNIIPISLSEVEEAIYGCSVEKMAEKQFPDETTPGWKDSFSPRERRGYITGFNTHKELVKDKLFTIEDMRKALSVVYRDWYQDTGHSENTEDEYYDRIIQSLLPKTEWEIQFDEQGKIKLI